MKLALALATMAMFTTHAASALEANPPKPQKAASPSACASIEDSQADVDRLYAIVSDAQIAYLTVRAESSSNNPKAKQCESVVKVGFQRLSRLKTSAAAEAIAKLILNPEMQWDFSDRFAIESHIVMEGSGPLVAPLLRSRISDSNIAKETLACIDEGRSTCM